MPQSHQISDTEAGIAHSAPSQPSASIVIAANARMLTLRISGAGQIREQADLCHFRAG